jgi:hypothetical protein
MGVRDSAKMRVRDSAKMRVRDEAKMDSRDDSNCMYIVRTLKQTTQQKWESVMKEKGPTGTGPAGPDPDAPVCSGGGQRVDSSE